MAAMTAAAAGVQLRRVARGGGLNLVGVGIATVANLALTVCLTRLTDPVVAGTFFAGTSALLLVSTVCRLGSNTGLVYFTAQAMGRSARPNLARLLATSRTPVLAVTVGAALLLVIAGPSFADSLGWATSGRSLWVVFALALPPMVMHEVWLAVTRGLHRMGPTVVIARVGIPVGQLVLVGVAAQVGLGTIELLLAWCLPYLVAAVAAWLVLRTTMSHVSQTEQSAAAEVTGRAYWRFTVPRAVASVAQIGMARLDILLVAALRGPTEAAIYVAATRFVVVGQLASQALGLSAQPHIAGAAARGDGRALDELYRLTTCWLVLMTWPAYLVSAAVAPELMQVFGDGYDNGVDVVLVMAAAMLVATASGMVDVFVNMAGRSSWTMITAFAGLVTMVVVDLVLIGPLGSIGAAIGWAAAIVVRNGLSLAVLYRQVGMKPFRGPGLLAGAVSLVTLGPSIVVTYLDTPSGLRLMTLAAGVVCWLVAVGAARRRLGLDLMFHRAGTPGTRDSQPISTTDEVGR